MSETRVKNQRSNGLPRLDMIEAQSYLEDEYPVKL